MKMLRSVVLQNHIIQALGCAQPLRFPPAFPFKCENLGSHGRKRRKLDTARQLYATTTSARLVAGAEEEDLVFEYQNEESSSQGAPSVGKQRLDAFLSTQLPDVSRAKLQAGIKSGLVTVNGEQQTKASHHLRLGDRVLCRLPPQAPLDAEPQDLPLQIVHEDDHLIVINKAAGMVVHPSPGNYTGTLVNGLLFHCKLPAMQVVLGNAMPQKSLTASDADGEEDGEVMQDVQIASLSAHGQMPTIRPGIVHRLDKGTTGLMVVAKDDFSHAHLCQQFKERRVQRTYQSIVVGVPKEPNGTIETNIVRDQKDRLKMTVTGFYSTRGRHAVSRYRVLEEIAVSRASLVEWRLETGRTHQIRVHAKHMGHPILADDTYSGGAATAVAVIGSTSPPRRQLVQQVVKALDRPALHAKTLGFEHPVSRERLQFTSPLPADFQGALDRLRSAE